MERSSRNLFTDDINQQEILGNVCLSEQIFYRKQSLGAPDSSSIKGTENFSNEDGERVENVTYSVNPPRFTLHLLHPAQFVNF